MQSDKVLNLPAGYFGIVLGTIGMGFAWRYASQVWQVSHWLGDGLAKMLFGYGLLQLLFMLRLMPWYLSQPFNASFWSFSFGVSALATTGLHLGSGSDNGFFHTLAVPLFIFTNFIIAILLIRTFALLMQGKLLVRTERAVLMKAEDKE
ncbi:hypothetical protein [Escherichia coli]|uniref:SLAC1 family transporter n=1 Tax=Escherichia coli TaxID=562 RepID=UPI0019CFD062|nr:hypothetical protein [Escherichia coli]MBV4728166.1 hypothetical protein [Escherichia coli]